MLLDAKYQEQLGRLEEQLHYARAITPELMSDVIAQACVRFAACAPAAKIRVNRLIETGAWTEATLALLEIELPQRKLRRLVLEDGEWLCSFSKQPWVPLEFDELAEATHEILQLAMLTAFLQARRAPVATGLRPVPQIHAASIHTVCCDNFA